MRCDKNTSKTALLVVVFLVILGCFFVMHMKHKNVDRSPASNGKYSVRGSRKHKEPTDTNDTTLSYGILLDCGSSGTRAYIYYWPPHSGGSHELLDIHPLIGADSRPWSKKVTPGLSTYDTDAKNAAEYLRPLLDKAAKLIPKAKHKQTPLYILATAGMRLIKQELSQAILDDITKDIPTWFDFQFEKSYATVISGKVEGMYAWISLNYMLRRFSHDRRMDSLHVTAGKERGIRKPTVGVVDMGGGSMQIAFEVDKTKLKSKKKVATFSLGSSETDLFHSYSLYVTTFLGFGANSALSRHRRRLINSSNSSSVVTDNCQAMESTEKQEVEGKSYQLQGTGNVSACMEDLRPLLNQTRHCSVKPCSLDGVYQPLIPTSTQFYGISEFWYSTYDVLNLKGYYNYEQVLKQAQLYCKRSWLETEKLWKDKKYPHADMARMRNECFKVSWIMEVLHDGLHFPKDFRYFHPVKEVDGQEVEWTLGALIHKTRFFAAKQATEEFVMGTSGHSGMVASVLPYMMFVCIAIVCGAIIVYCRHLQQMKAGSGLGRTPSKSYLMAADQLEQGVVEDKKYYT